MSTQMGSWYKRSQLGFRVAVFSSAQTFSGAFGGLLAAAISKMDGIGGKPAWAWIFIIEGKFYPWFITNRLISYRFSQDYSPLLSQL
jgi:MFS family permease